MAYSREKFTGEENPWTEGFLIPAAVPGYWEDMAEAFAEAPFFAQLRVNPEYGLQRYPIAGVAPDMALPNIMGTFFYRRSFLCRQPCRTALLHFEGVQNTARVWLNGVYLGCHEGYCTPFEMEIPQGVLRDGENEIVAAVSNIGLEGYAGEPVSGLTSRAANEYTGGITGAVELRIFSGPLRDAAVLVSEDCRRVDVELTLAGEALCRWAVYDGDRLCKEGTCGGGFSFAAEGLEPWTPDAPKLYTLEISCGGNRLRRKFGVRRLTVDGVHLRLNGKPCYLRGACEHCYFPETVHPNHDSGFYREVIRKLKELGFNFIRFHTFVPEEEYMQAADELGMLLEVESPNNTTVPQWREIVDFCRRHTSVVLYSCGNELLIDEPFLEHLHCCADIVHSRTDGLFSPMSALRGLEYYWEPSNLGEGAVQEPFAHNPARLTYANSFSDVYNSYTQGLTSYNSLDADAEKLDDWSRVYNRPRLSHEICIQGTYTDLSLEPRYGGTRVGKTAMFSSLREHLESKGLLKKAPLYFRNSCQWQRRLRKHCFESVRACANLAGYDFLGPIDTHWHTFGYDVGMMNEFYELKPGETERDVRMYNGPTVLLSDLGTDRNFIAGKELSVEISVSHYGPETLRGACLELWLTAGQRCCDFRRILLDTVEAGTVSKVYKMNVRLPETEQPEAMELRAVLTCGSTLAENEWELYLFPEAEAEAGELLVAENMTEAALTEALQAGKSILLLGTELFMGLPTSFQMSLAGRTSGNLATVIADHPALGSFPHRGFCGWQFRRLLEGGRTVCFEGADVPFAPIIEVASSHKHIIRQGILFEFRAYSGKILVCGFRFDRADPAACWLKAQLTAYGQREAFDPELCLSPEQLSSLIHGQVARTAGNNNRAFNPNDKTAVRGGRKLKE